MGRDRPKVSATVSETDKLAPSKPKVVVAARKGRKAKKAKAPKLVAHKKFAHTSLSDPVSFMEGFSESHKETEIQWLVWDKFLVGGAPFSKEPLWKRKAKSLNFGKSLARYQFQYARKRIEEALIKCKSSESVTLTLPWWEAPDFDTSLYKGFAWLCTKPRLNWLMRGLVYTSKVTGSTITITFSPTEQEI